MPVEFTARFLRNYATLPLIVRRKADKAINILDVNFRHPGLRSHPVMSAPGVFEAYVDNKYRMTFERRGDKIILRNIDNHDECLKHP